MVEVLLIALQANRVSAWATRAELSAMVDADNERVAFRICQVVRQSGGLIDVVATEGDLY
ncbi:hypothetical protein PHLCEN_2v6429 [Hermanssonia centrifuga]|uniref:Uncharacterized protein n=1 Tax=Hermanssonia centrifuga TaxID=98765 RepID=A0A2R6P053_9APHY|nr:hypothetical protein PHLCEN_2v6429 [Hermanssonia centrifuga]